MEQEEKRQLIVQNTQKGQHYRIMFSHDSAIYEGIPVISPDRDSGDPDAFEMRLVTPPGEDAKVIRRSISDIAWLEPIS